MAGTTGSPVGYVTRSLSLTFDIDGTPQEVSCAVLGAKFTRGGRQKMTSSTGCGPVTDYGLPEDSLDVAYNVDKAAGSFHRMLIEHEGEDVTATLTDPRSGVAESATVRLSPGAEDSNRIGEFATASVSLGVTGDITITDPVAAP
jgi:hypothetical protein